MQCNVSISNELSTITLCIPDPLISSVHATDNSMKPHVREFLMVDKCRKEYTKYLHIFNGKKMITNFDDGVLSRLLTEEIERESYDYYANHYLEYNQDDVEKFSKSSEKSTAARLKGNELLAKKSHNAKVHEEILKLYSKSVALAPLKSEELALAYGNRSYLLMHIGQFKESMKDIERSSALTKSESLKLKLLCRKMTCLAGLKDTDGQKNTWNDIKTHYDRMDRTLKDQKMAKLVEKARDSLTNFQCDAPPLIRRPIVPSHNLVSLKSDKKSGEYLAADRDIDPAEVVLTFKPFVTGANSNKFYAYCGHCLSVMWASIPCDGCSLIMFCSENCKADAWKKYHDIECRIIPHMQIELLFYFFYQMAVRSLIIAVKETGSLRKLLATLTESDNSPNEIAESLMEHRNVGKAGFMNLYKAPVNLKLDIFIQFLRNTCLVLNLIMQTTNICDTDLKNLTGRELARDKRIIPPAVLILKLVCLAFSHHTFAGQNEGGSCKDGNTMEDCTVHRCCARGALLVPGVHRIKSDCNPNVVGVIKEYDGRLIYFSSQPIKKGDMITSAKYGLFYKQAKHVRQENMSTMNFKCACRACIKGWPTLSGLDDNYRRNPSSPENALLPHLIPKYEAVIENQVADRNYQPSTHKIEEISQDIKEAFRASGGRATLLTCLLMEYLYHMLCRLHCIHPIDVSEKCYMT
ncbi:hypothetical protein QAD02_016431 [Eretmocerus hayati]|uniref:Uncharacterized protein n=1 Tax=Eretmocerus hayati TaxID=131215 RepID=A0ACC2PDH5_9HYME|nr:hypothetical protein QAD02_016431 [Eretmocerus hayati]